MTDANPAAGPCPFCHAQAAALVVAGRDWEFGTPSEYYVYRCRRCSWRWTMPRLTPAQLAALYPPENYYAYRPGARPLGAAREAVIRVMFGYPNWVKPAWRAWARAAAPLFRRRYYGIPRYVRGGRLLDVGAGAGHYLAVGASLGWYAVGVELNPGAVGEARAAGLYAVAGDAAAVLAGADLPGTFDFVRIHHALEHVADPAAVLRAAAAVARPDARLLVAVPNAAGVLARLFGRFWYHWALPFHQSHFDAPALRGLLRVTGWEPEREYCVSSAEGITQSLRYALCREKAAARPWRWSRGAVWGKLLRPVLFALDVLHLGENLIIEAVRRQPTPHESGRAV